MFGAMHNLLWHRIPRTESVEIFWPWEQHHDTRMALDVHVASCLKCVMEVRPIFDGEGQRDMLTIDCPTGELLIAALREAVPPKSPSPPRRSTDVTSSRRATRPRARPR